MFATHGKINTLIDSFVLVVYRDAPDKQQRVTILSGGMILIFLPKSCMRRM
jgi:hypothetical protein